MELEYLFKNRVKKTTIRLARNYSRIVQDDNKPLRYQNSIEVPYFNSKYKNRFFFKVKKEDIPESLLQQYNYDNIFYINLHCYRQVITDDDRHITKHYKNPFADIVINVKKHEIYKKDNKLFLSYYTMHKTRGFNRRFFLKRYEKHSLSFHLETGNFFYRKEIKDGKGTTTKIRQNNFRLISRALRSMFEYENFKQLELVIKIFNILRAELGFDFNSIEEFAVNYVKYFVEKRKIKTPDRYENLMFYNYPTEKYLKKNNRKLVSAITDRLDIKCKLTTKLINQYPEDIGIPTLFKFRVFFGKDFYKYLSQIDHKYFLKSNIGWRSQRIRLELIGKQYNLAKKEKQAMLAYINDTLEGEHLESIEDCFRQIEDHYRMFIQLKEYLPNPMFTTRTFESFNAEHARLAGLQRKIHKETTIEFEFLPETVEKIEEEIVSFTNDKKNETIILKPYLLKNEEEYHDEGDYMHHCVGGYVNYYGSIIISLRTLDGKDRITNEYKTQNGQCVQSRHFCNRTPPEHFEHALEILNERARSLARLGTLQYIDKKRVPIKINGVEVLSKISDNMVRRELQNPFAEDVERDVAVAPVFLDEDPFGF